MEAISKKGILEYFSEVEDPRRDGYAKRHKLFDIITIAICGVVSRCDTWEDIEDITYAREKWFKTFLELPNGIPSHDTLRRVFNELDPEVFEGCFMEWTRDVYTLSKGEVIAIDGKTARGSHDKENKQKPIHIVSAWANENQAVLGQVKVADKTNEITAIPQLLEMLRIEGCIVTIDAMGCQRQIAEKILEKQGDYLLALKGNQKDLLEDVRAYFQTQKDRDGYDSSRTVEKDHGRIEHRTCWASSDVDWLNSEHHWPGLKSIAMVESRRDIGQGPKLEQRFYISSLEANPKKLLQASRAHWGIENSLHWVLDVTFNEDKSRVRKNNGAQNFALLRKTALNLIKQVQDKRSLKRRRFMASIDQDYLINVLGLA